MEMKKLQFVPPEEFLAAKVPVSDIAVYTASSASISCYDRERRTVYAPYHASRTGFGEQAAVFALARVPLENPAAAVSSVLLESDEVVDGQSYHWPIDGSTIFRDGMVRVFVLANGDNYYFMDWNPVSCARGPIRPVKCRYDGHEAEPLTASAVKTYLESKGMSGFNLLFDSHEHIINTAKPAWETAADGSRTGAFYGAISSGLAQPVVYRCADGETFEFLGVIPELASYECQVAFLNGRIYALLRGAKGDNFWTSEDGGKTFQPAGRLEMAETRPQLMAFHGKLLIGFSENGIIPNRIRDGRNNLRIIVGEGTDLSSYKKVYELTDPIGFVYFDFIDCDGALLAIWSNSERYPDKQVWGCLQGKDALFCSWLAR